MPLSFWHHALEMATYLLNILPSKILKNYSPTQLLYHRDPSYAHLRVFGCLCYLFFLPPKEINSKLDPLHVSFWDTRLIIGGINVMICLAEKLFSLDMSYLMSPNFRLPSYIPLLHTPMTVLMMVYILF